MWDIFVGIFNGIVLLLIERFLLLKDCEKKEKISESIIEPERVIKSE